MFELIGITGIAISVLAYLPQVTHLARERCSAGVSSRAWTMWLLSSVLIGALALHRHDLVFILLQVSSLMSAAIILLLAQRYRGMVCEGHARGYPQQPPGDRSQLFAQASRVDFGVSDRGLAPRRWRLYPREMESRPDGGRAAPRRRSG